MHKSIANCTRFLMLPKILISFYLEIIRSNFIIFILLNQIFDVSKNIFLRRNHVGEIYYLILLHQIFDASKINLFLRRNHLEEIYYKKMKFKHSAERHVKKTKRPMIGRNFLKKKKKTSGLPKIWHLGRTQNKRIKQTIYYFVSCFSGCVLTSKFPFRLCNSCHHHHCEWIVSLCNLSKQLLQFVDVLPDVKSKKLGKITKIENE